MLILVAYDVNTEGAEGRRRLRRVARVCQNYGQRVQKSVFECSVDKLNFEMLERNLVAEIDKEEDNLRLYRLAEPVRQHSREYGKFKAIDFDGTLII